MDVVRRFWRQPSSHYRNFQIVCALLAVHFLVPSVIYVAAPEAAIGQFSTLNQWLGGVAYRAPEAQSYVFRFLGAANVATLGFMCIWMQRDLRNRFAVLTPLVFLKGLAATLWLGGFAAMPRYPAMLAVSLFDYAVCAVLIVFTVLARADIHRLSDGLLVPEPVGRTGLEWLPFEQRWVESILAATIPARPDDDLPGFSEIDLDDYWEKYLDNVPLHFRLGLRAATWTVTFWPIVTFRSIRTFHGLSEDRKDEILCSIENSGSFVIRQVAFVLKTTASFAYFRDVGVQQHFPGAYPSAPDPESDSPEREPPEPSTHQPTGDDVRRQ